MMDTGPEELARVREEGRLRARGFTKAEDRRRELAGVVDTGSLSDEDVALLYAAFRAGMESAAVGDRR